MTYPLPSSTRLIADLATSGRVSLAPVLMSHPERVAALREECDRLVQALADFGERSVALEEENAVLRGLVGRSWRSDRVPSPARRVAIRLAARLLRAVS